MPFATLGLAPELLPAFSRALDAAGYTAPTPIQAQAVAPILRGEDLLACAATGSGKTAAFALPLLQHAALLPPSRRVRSLVLVPTRELVAQVGDTLQALGRYLPRRVKVAAVAGGASINPQMLKLRGGADIVVATPGRLLDLAAHNALDLGAVHTLVLDEADRLLALGFEEELGRILALLPRRRQTLLFSATFPAEVDVLAQRLLRGPRRIGEEAAAAPATIRQRAIEVDSAQRTALLRHLLHSEAWPQALVFVASQRGADNLAEKLHKAGVAAQPFHGELSQGRRNQALAGFRSGQLQVLVATDVAARGLDIAQLPVVVNYDLPRATADYTHRIGRTGRAGADGLAVSFVDAASEAHLLLIEKRQRLRVPRERIAGFEPTQTAAPAAETAPQTGGIKGKRPSKKDKLRAAAAQGSGGLPAKS
ncbi:DEAD/DEAH box helicase [Xanthomonas sp. NCPPB 2654]|uniref:DEAD/DEAH box helicase n=1 Tax=unclassified Xanthomonas TaxID=2643310 RepID=UPI0021E0B34F|nr:MULTISPECIES: DEAD/DEAH box helicase [unclassified Xanthomonas]MDL5366593.1 DEAD/DEAH box helicase [Xanthomonas sp. NCPPB 2654]UYC21156.1 DEAD/DEAH box helicase [Xanthomonas sp. CFBP 8443]